MVGASATGVQLAAELRQSGRPVILSVGEHVRLPRTYRGRDVLWWMDASGVWDQRYDEVDDLTRARRLPSPQLVGTPDRTTLDLNALAAMGVELVGRLAAVRDGRALFSGGLRNVCSLADLKMERLLGVFDEWARDRRAETGGRRLPSASRRRRCHGHRGWSSTCASGEIRAIVWATGFAPDYGWLDVPVVDAKGHLRHDGGAVDSPGLYALGLPVLRRRKSTFIHGIEDDAREVIDHLSRVPGRRLAGSDQTRRAENDCSGLVLIVWGTAKLRAAALYAGLRSRTRAVNSSIAAAPTSAPSSSSYERLSPASSSISSPRARASSLPATRFVQGSIPTT